MLDVRRQVRKVSARKYKSDVAVVGDDLGHILVGTLLRHTIEAVVELGTLESLLDALLDSLVAITVVNDGVTLARVKKLLNVRTSATSNTNDRVNV